MTVGELIDEGQLRIIKPLELFGFKGKRLYLSTSSVNEESIIGNEGFVTYSNRPSRACMNPVMGSVWFAKMKDTCKVLFIDSIDKSNCILSSGFYGLLPIGRAKGFLGKWLKYYFLSKEFNLQKDSLSEGGTMSSIKESLIGEILIPQMLKEEEYKFSLNTIDSLTQAILLAKIGKNQLSSIKSFLIRNLFN